MSLERLVEMLTEFGLTSHQARVYLAAVQTGLASASRVSQVSNVRREDTYQALKNLEELGLAERISGRPVRIRAVSVEDALVILTKRWEEAVKNRERALEARKNEFLEYFKTCRKPITSVEENHFALLAEKDLLVKKLRMMFEDAEMEIDLMTSQDELIRLLPESFAKRLLEIVASKRVNMRIILEVPPNETPRRRLVEDYLPSGVSVDLRYSWKPLSHYFVIDHKRALMATSREQSFGKVPYLWTDDGNFTRLLQKNFEDSWHDCVKPETDQPAA